FKLIATVNLPKLVEVSNLTLEIHLPDNVQYIDFSSGNVICDIIKEPSTREPGDSLILHIDKLKGDLTTEDVKIELSAFIRKPERSIDSLRSYSLTAIFKVKAIINNDTKVSKETYYNFSAVLYRIVETYSLSEDRGPKGISPLDILEFEIRVDVSDFIRTPINNITQILSDGLNFVGEYIPILRINQRGSLNSLSLVPDKDFTITPRDNKGNLKITFYVSKALARVTEGEGNIVGGLYDLIVRDGYKYTPPYNTSGYGYGKTYLVIKFKAKIGETYFRNKLGNEYIVSNDILKCKVILDLKLYKDSHLTVIKLPENDIEVHATKTNLLIPGKDVTIAVKFRLPLGRSEKVKLTLKLPKPILLVNYSKGVKPFRNNTLSLYRGGGNPPSGYWSIGVYDTLFSRLGVIPRLISLEKRNELILYYGDIQANITSELIGEVYFTLKATDFPYILPKTMLIAELSYENSYRQLFVKRGALEFKVINPLLSVSKRIVNRGEFYPDAGDTVRFKAEIINRGEAPAYDVVLNLVLDTCSRKDTLSICSMPYLANLTGLRIFFLNGTEIPISYNITYSELTYEGRTYRAPTLLSIDLKRPINPGESIILEYNLTLGSEIAPAQRMVDILQIKSYSSIPGGDNLIDPQDPPTRSNVLLTKKITCNKTLVSSDEGTEGSYLTIGEEALIRASIRLPEGFIGAGKLRIIESIPPGMTYVKESLRVYFRGIKPIPWRIEAPWEILGSPSPGDSFEIVFDEAIRVPPDNDPANDPEIVILYKIRVADIKENYELGADFIREVTGRTDITVYETYEPCVAQKFYVVRPQLLVKKVFEPEKAYPGQRVNVSITITNIGSSPAFETEVTDVLDATIFDLKSFTLISEPSIFNYTYSMDGRLIISGNLGPGDKDQLKFSIKTLKEASAPQTLSNLLTIKYTTLKGVIAREATLTGQEVALFKLATCNPNIRLYASANATMVREG
ncbi:MAG TPA: DUF11 domain-containing protein, partial [Thermofilum sp.]|nr:DUF11 domain-containing protein [Thermofilum sp.]